MSSSGSGTIARANTPPRREAGFQLSPLATAAAVAVFAVLLFASRNLNRSEQEANDTVVAYSARYLELAQKDSLGAAERAELELETCRFERDTLRFLLTKPLATAEAELAAYRRDCEDILPLGPVAR